MKLRKPVGETLGAAMKKNNRVFCENLFCSIALIGVLVTPSAPAFADGSWDNSFNKGTSALAQQDLQSAETAFRTALEIARKQKNSSETMSSLQKLASTLALRNKTDEAQNLYQELLDLQQQKFGAQSKETIPTLYEIGSFQESQGNHTVAMQYYQRALAINEKHFGSYSPAFADNLHRMGRATYKSGDRVAAEKHYKQALSILLQQPSLTASDQLQSLMSDYGDLLKGTDNSNANLLKQFNKEIGTVPVASGGRTTSGDSSWERVSRLRLKTVREEQINDNSAVANRALSQPDSDSTLDPAFKIMNDSIFKLNRYGKNESYYKRIIATDLDALGSNHPSVANDLNGLAQLYISEQRYTAAEPLLRRALSIYEQAYGQNNLLTINTQMLLGSALFHMGNADEAAKIYKNALSSGQSALGPNSVETSRILNDLAYLYFQQGKLEEARTYYKWAIASTEAALGNHDPLVAACLKDYANVLRAMGLSQEASEADSKANMILANAK